MKVKPAHLRQKRPHDGRGNEGQAVEEPHRGYLLFDGTTPVGFFATIFSRRVLGGKSYRFCATSSWFVLEPYRWASLELMRPIERVDRHMPLTELLERFRHGGSHFALVEESDGKVVGYLTMEDVLEALVGDIQDEHRKAERGIVAYQPGKLLVRGETPLLKVERLLQISLPADIEADTLSGLIHETLKRLPEEDEVLEAQGLRIIVKKMKGPRVVLAKVLKL